MTEDRYWIHLHDEAPLIGSGRRLVRATVGFKWVKVRNLYSQRVRLPLKTWLALNPEKVPE